MRVCSVVILVALLVIGMASATQARPAGGDGVPGFGHVFLIVGENTSFRQVSPRNAPYLTGTVIPNGAWLTNYHGLTDGSLGDYAAMVSGQFVMCERSNDFSFTSGDVPGQIACHQSVDNLFHQLDGRGIPWQEWTESATNSCDMFDHGTTWSRNLFVSHHSPALYFDDIQANHGSEDVIPSSECREKVLAAGTTGPNDMSVQASPEFGADGLIVLVWDEGSDADPLHVGGALLGPEVKPSRRAAKLDHYSLLRTLEDGFGIARHLAHAAHARPFTGVWR
jgi:acid phosphatase